MSGNHRRKAVSKKTRFDVFKRDSFTCQYCGSSAPDVILNVDHIKPVSAGGDNDPMNLVTSCEPCNSGKGPRQLDDHSVIVKQKRQLDDLNERRLQAEMLCDYRTELKKEPVPELPSVFRFWLHLSKAEPRDSDRDAVEKLLVSAGLRETLHCIEIVTDQYSNAEQAIRMLPRVAAVRRKTKRKPYLRDLLYIRGILRNRLTYVNERMALKLMENAVEGGASTDQIRDASMRVVSWPDWKAAIGALHPQTEG